MKKAFILGMVMVIVALSAPMYASAAPTSADGGQGSGRAEDSNFQIVPCDNVSVPCDFKAFMIGVNRVLKFLLFLSIPLVMGMMIYTAFKFMTAGGDPGKLADAKKMFIPVALGIFWVMAAYITVYTFIDKLVNPAIQGEAKEAIKLLDNRKSQ